MATWLSLACAVHCLVFPIALSVLPLYSAAGFFAFGPSTELALTVMVVVSSVAGVAWGYRRHSDARVLYATATGLAVYLAGHTLEPAWFGTALAIVGALTLAASSFASARLSHHVNHASCAH
jgi:hypothetical protein